MARQNRAMTVEKLRQYILPHVFWNFMYREEVKRNLQSFTRFYSPYRKLQAKLL